MIVGSAARCSSRTARRLARPAQSACSRRLPCLGLAPNGEEGRCSDPGSLVEIGQYNVQSAQAGS